MARRALSRHCVRFDVLIVCSRVALPVALAPWLARYGVWLRIERAYLLLAFLLLVFMECSSLQSAIIPIARVGF